MEIESLDDLLDRVRILAEKLRSNECSHCGERCTCHLVMRGLGLSDLEDSLLEKLKEQKFLHSETPSERTIRNRRKRQTH